MTPEQADALYRAARDAAFDALWRAGLSYPAARERARARVLRHAHEYAPHPSVLVRTEESERRAATLPEYVPHPEDES